MNHPSPPTAADFETAAIEVANPRDVAFWALVLNVSVLEVQIATRLTGTRVGALVNYLRLWRQASTRVH